MKTLIGLLCLTAGILMASALMQKAPPAPAETKSPAIQELDVTTASATALLESADQLYAAQKPDEFGFHTLCGNARLATEIDAFPPKTREAMGKLVQTQLTAQRMLLLVVREAALEKFDLDAVQKNSAIGSLPSLQTFGPIGTRKLRPRQVTSTKWPKPTKPQ
ncbi:MAG: hypothetical protein ABL888_22025 [Pirellulaceae bacterium]